MRKIKIALCLAALGLAASAHADTNSDGTVTFNGKLISETCKVDPSTKDVVVTLPTVSTSKLAAAGQEIGSTAFQIKVIDCPTEIKKVGAHFEAIANTGFNAETGNLKNQTSPTAGADDKAATNVEVRLYNTSDNQQIKVGDSNAATFDVATDGTATLSYAGGYYAIGATTPGLVYAQTQYVLKYE